MKKFENKNNPFSINKKMKIFTISFPIFIFLFNNNFYSLSILEIIFNSCNFILEWIIKILFFFWYWILIIVYIYYKNHKRKKNMNYKITKFELSDFILIFSKSKKFKGFSILEISEIPHDISVKEIRSSMNTIEKLQSDDNRQYLHYHLTAIAKYLGNSGLSYEIVYKNKRIKLIIIIHAESKSKTELKNILKLKIGIIEKIYQDSFKINFKILKNKILKRTFFDILGGFGDFGLRTINGDILEIDQKSHKLYLQFLKITGKPFMSNDKKIQIDELILNLLLSSDINNCSLIINAVPISIFSSKKGMKQKSIKPSININDINISKFNVRQDILDLRHNDIMALWKVSAYLVVKSKTEKLIEENSRKLTSILHNNYSHNKNRIRIEKITKEKILYLLPNIISRNNLNENDDDSELTSRDLAIYFHLPERSLLSFSDNIPIFEIPTENKIDSKMTIGKVVLNNRELYNIGLDLIDLSENMIITGVEKINKTAIIMRILLNLIDYYSDIPFCVIDMGGSYKNIINYQIKSQKNYEILVIQPGNDKIPFYLNIFNPGICDKYQHIRKVSILLANYLTKINNTLNIEKTKIVCNRIIQEVVNNSNRNYEFFLNEINQYKLKYPEISNEEIQILNTINDIFRSNNNLKNILSKDYIKNFWENIFREKVIIDFSYLIKNGLDVNSIKFLMNLILKKIFDMSLNNENKSITDELSHLTIIEEAQLIDPVVIREVADTQIEDLSILLKKRKEGLILVSNRPNFSQDIINNSKIKIAFRSQKDFRKISDFLELNIEQERYLRVMPDNEAIIKIPNFQYPFRIRINQIFMNGVKNSEIINNNQECFSSLHVENQVEINKKQVIKSKESRSDGIFKDNIEQIEKKIQSLKEELDKNE